MESHDPSQQIEAAHAAAGEQWAERALECVRLLAHVQPEIISGDLWEYVGMPPSGEGRAIGGVMRRAANRGYIQKTDKTVEWRPYLPEMTGNLGRTTTVWKSLIYEGDREAI